MGATWGMDEMQVIDGLREKRSELAEVMKTLEQQLAGHLASLAHLDATMRLFDPTFGAEEVCPRRPRSRSAWFRPGECLRLIYDVLRDAPAPVTTRELAERMMQTQRLVVTDERGRELFQKTILGSLNRAKETIERIETAGVVRWRTI